MKKILNALGVGVLLTLVLWSCQKADPGPQPQPGGGNGGTNTPVVYATTPARVFYGNSANITLSGSNITTIIAGTTDLKMTAGIYSTGPIIQSTKIFPFYGVGTNGTNSQTVSVVAGAYSQDSSRLAYAPAGKNPVWSCDTARFKNGVDSPWRAGIKACQPTTFHITGGSTFYQGDCNGLPTSTGNPWYCSNGSLLWLGRVYQVTFPNDVTLVRSITTKVMWNGQLVDQTVEETFTKRYE